MTNKSGSPLKIIISDVDETIADLYKPAADGMIEELEKLLVEIRLLFLISGQSVNNIVERLVFFIKEELRCRILIGHCSGAEVWGFNEKGILNSKPFYSEYQKIHESRKEQCREIGESLLSEFKLEIDSSMPIPDFEKKHKENPFAVMLEDRGPQITFEVVNGHEKKLSEEGLAKIKKKLPHIGDISDFRMPIVTKANEMFKKNNLPFVARYGGEFAIDFVINGVTKATPVQYFLQDKELQRYFGLSEIDLNHPKNIQVWGDNFCGADKEMLEPLDKSVLAISFRDENTDKFPNSRNIKLWDGEKRLHEGLLEYLQSGSHLFFNYFN